MPELRTNGFLQKERLTASFLSTRAKKFRKHQLSEFFHLCPQDTTSFDRRSTSLSARGHKTMLHFVQMMCFAMMLVSPNDVGLRPTMLRFAQTDCLLAILVQGSGNEQLSCFMRIILKNTPQCDTMQSERRCNYVTSEL